MKLTDRQAEVLQYAMRGCTAKATAAEMGISERTVNQYRGQVLDALGAQSMTQAGAIALSRGLVKRPKLT